MPHETKKLFVFLSVLIIASLIRPDPWQSLARSQSKNVAPQELQVKLIFCHDGDTCRARNALGMELKLRLIGIDAPEIAWNKKAGQAYGQESRDFLNKRVSGKYFKIQIMGADKYNRHLALILDPELKNASRSINEELVEKGFAFAYQGRARQQSDIQAWAMAAQKNAQRTQVGLWKLNPRPINPSLFRQLKN